VVLLFLRYRRLVLKSLGLLVGVLSLCQLAGEGRGVEEWREERRVFLWILMKDLRDAV
jgi:hypothetical protein